MATVVQYGRRKGTPKSQDISELTRQTVKPNQIVLLSRNDWSRIQQQLSGVNEEKEEAKRRLEQRKAKHQISQATVKHWENTIEGQRLKRLENRKLKALKDEEKKMKSDEEEARYQAALRKDAIERAKTMLYYKTDRVKGFHSGLVLSEVLREREVQIGFKKTKEALLDHQDDEFIRQQEEEKERGKLADIEAAKQRIKAKHEVALFQLKQASESATWKKQQRQLQLDEQTALEKEVKEWEEKEKEKERKRQREKELHKSELDQVLAYKNTAIERMKKQQVAEDEERKIFADAKKNMMKLRKAKEAEIFQELQEHQQKMNTQLRNLMQQKVSDEDERIAKAVTEQQAKKDNDEREKHDKFTKSMKDIFHHRIKMMSEHDKIQKEHQALDEELLRQRVAQDEKFHAAQFIKQKKSAMEAKEFQQFHKAQMVEKTKRDETEQLEEKDCWQKNMNLWKVEEDQFQQYAQKVINEAKDRGAPTYPLQVTAKTGAGGGKGPVFSGKGGLRPSYQTTDSTGIELPSYESKELPVSCYRRDTQKRMGFTW